MGKAADSKRKALFEELENNGKMKPLYQKRVRAKKEEPKVETVGCYCRDRYQNDLPSGFRSCYGCPLDSEEQVR